MSDQYLETDELDIEIRAAEEIHARMQLCLANAERALLELLSLESSVDELYAHETDRYALFRQITSGDLRLDARDLSVLSSPAGELDGDLLDSIMLDGFAASTLGWVLSEDLRMDPDLVRAVESLPTLPDVRSVEVRDAQEIWDARQRWWVVYTRGLIDSIDDADLAREALSELVELAGDLDFVVEKGDVFVMNRPWTRLAPEDRERLQVEGEGRLLALTWVCGFGDTWDTAPVDLFPNEDAEV